MLELNHQDVFLNQQAVDKFVAIASIAQHLTDSGLVTPGYAEGMLHREKQNSTYLGSGIAIPHGTIDTRDKVTKTGCVVHHFPQGVDWGEGNLVYVAIGIAAKSDEHLEILKQLTKVLSAHGVEDKLKAATTEREILSLIQGELQLVAEFSTDTIQLAFPAVDMTQMSAVAAGLLKHAGYVDSSFVADVVVKAPVPLGNGLWLVSSHKQVARTAASLVTAEKPFEHQGQLVQSLLVISACNDSHKALLDKLMQLVVEHKQDWLAKQSAAQIVAFFSGEESNMSADVTKDNSAVYRIINAHGLHARPGAILVAEAKKFASNITVCNLDGTGSFVNAKSLMKVIALGVKHGHQLQFVAEGDDAQQALQAIGNVIASGLGEG